jgi:hypothetical protein
MDSSLILRPKRRLRTAFVLTLLTFTQLQTSRIPALAGPLTTQPGISVQRVSTGAAPFDASTFDAIANTNAGDDANATNDVVRTSQLTTYLFDLNLIDSSAATTTPYDNFTVTTDPLPLGLAWSSLPTLCSGIGSAVTGNGKTVASRLVCNLGQRQTGSSFSFNASVYAYNTVANGSTFLVRGTAAVTGSTLTATSSSPVTKVTSAPRWDVVKRFYSAGAVVTFPDKTGTLKVGAYYRYFIGIKAPAGGAEPLQLPLVIHEDIRGVTPNAVFYVRPGGIATQPGCENTSFVAAPLPYGYNAGRTAVTRSILTAATLSCPHAANAQEMDITVSGIDMSPDAYPLYDAAGVLLPPNERYVASIEVPVFIPYDDLSPTATATENVVSRLTGIGINSGLANYGATGEPGVGLNQFETLATASTQDDGTNNDFFYSRTRPTLGSFDKFDGDHPYSGLPLASNKEDVNLPGFYLSSSARSGDAYLARNSVFQGRHQFIPNGVVDLPAGLINCATFDNRYLSVQPIAANPNDAAWIWSSNGNSGAEWVIEYGVGGQGGITTSTVDGRTT